MLGRPDETGPYPELTPEQRELAELLSRAMVSRLNLTLGAVLEAVYEDVRSLVQLAHERQHVERGRLEP